MSAMKQPPNFTSEDGTELLFERAGSNVYLKRRFMWDIVDLDTSNGVGTTTLQGFSLTDLTKFAGWCLAQAVYWNLRKTLGLDQ